MNGMDPKHFVKSVCSYFVSHSLIPGRIINNTLFYSVQIIKKMSFKPLSPHAFVLD